MREEIIKNMVVLKMLYTVNVIYGTVLHSGM